MANLANLRRSPFNFNGLRFAPARKRVFCRRTLFTRHVHCHSPRSSCTWQRDGWRSQQNREESVLPPTLLTHTHTQRAGTRSPLFLSSNSCKHPPPTACVNPAGRWDKTEELSSPHPLRILLSSHKPKSLCFVFFPAQRRASVAGGGTNEKPR